jgi:hypothetical protein
MAAVPVLAMEITEAADRECHRLVRPARPRDYTPPAVTPTH